MSTAAFSPSTIPEPLQCGRFKLSFERPLVMGILNVTPDSFSDGGQYAMRADALRQAERMMLEGADIIDIGGESTRPGAPPVPLDEELERVIPLIEQLRGANVPLSVDTYKPEVMRHALSAGADLINDIWGFRMPGAVDAVRESDCGLCVMHMLGEPQSMQLGEPAYGDVVSEVRQFLDSLRARQYEAAYKIWGPSKDYPLNKFMEDWGQRPIGAFEITRSRTCGSGVVITVDLQKGQEENLWVQNSDRTIGFSPFAGGCPAAR